MNKIWNSDTETAQLINTHRCQQQQLEVTEYLLSNMATGEPTAVICFVDRVETTPGGTHETHPICEYRRELNTLERNATRR